MIQPAWTALGKTLRVKKACLACPTTQGWGHLLCGGAVGGNRCPCHTTPPCWLQHKKQGWTLYGESSRATHDSNLSVLHCCAVFANLCWMPLGDTGTCGCVAPSLAQARRHPVLPRRHGRCCLANSYQLTNRPRLSIQELGGQQAARCPVQQVVWLRCMRRPRLIPGQPSPGRMCAPAVRPLIEARKPCKG